MKKYIIHTTECRYELMDFNNAVQPVHSNWLVFEKDNNKFWNFHKKCIVSIVEENISQRITNHA